MSLRGEEVFPPGEAEVFLPFVGRTVSPDHVMDGAGADTVAAAPLYSPPLPAEARPCNAPTFPERDVTLDCLVHTVFMNEMPTPQL